jgi:hypothetical protein
MVTNLYLRMASKAGCLLPRYIERPPLRSLIISVRKSYVSMFSKVLGFELGASIRRLSQVDLSGRIVFDGDCAYIRGFEGLESLGKFRTWDEDWRSLCTLRYPTWYLECHGCSWMLQVRFECCQPLDSNQECPGVPGSARERYHLGTVQLEAIKAKIQAQGRYAARTRGNSQAPGAGWEPL